MLSHIPEQKTIEEMLYGSLMEPNNIVNFKKFYNLLVNNSYTYDNALTYLNECILIINTIIPTANIASYYGYPNIEAIISRFDLDEEKEAAIINVIKLVRELEDIMYGSSPKEENEYVIMNAMKLYKKDLEELMLQAITALEEEVAEYKKNLYKQVKINGYCLKLIDEN